MFDPQTALLCRYVEARVVTLSSEPEHAGAWADLRQATEATRASNPELVAAIEARDVPALRALIEAWHAGKQPLPPQDQEVLRRALKAFTKSLKVTQLNDESTLGGRGMSGGRTSGIVGITPPARFPREVWDELVHQGKLRGGRQGIYELAAG